MGTIREALSCSFQPHRSLMASRADVVIGKTLEAVKALEKMIGMDLTSPIVDSKL
jgi:hypothetical protein